MFDEKIIQHILGSYPIYSVLGGGGDVVRRANYIHQAINNLFPLVDDLATIHGGGDFPLVPQDSYAQNLAETKFAETVKNAFNAYNSDKSRTHDYHLFYGPLLMRLPQPMTALVESGMGSTNDENFSSMGANGSPGASLRAFRDLTLDCPIYGGDIDRSILFSEERIQTFQVDLMDGFSLLEFAEKVPDGCDLVIDDGLHSAETNLNFIKYMLNKIRIGGSLVIEDIDPVTLPLWRLVARLLAGDRYNCEIIQTRQWLLFHVQRIA